MAILFLVDEKTGMPIKVGDVRETFRGDKVTVTGWSHNGRAQSTGRVHVRFDDDKFGDAEYYPSVIGAKLI